MATPLRTSQEWLAQSRQLLEARPATTRIVTHYTIRKAECKPREEGQPPAPEKPPRGRLVLKTYDDASGACLSYRTSKAAEVSRLVQMLGSLGRGMAALPSRREDDVLLQPPGAAAPTTTTAAAAGTVTPTTEAEGSSSSAQPQQQQQQQQQPAQTTQPAQQGGGGGKAKKKKGKR